MVPSLFAGFRSNHFFATQNVLVQFPNPKEGLWMEYCFSVGFLFCSPLEISSSISSISVSFECDLISRDSNFAFRTDRDLALGIVKVLVSIFPKISPAYCTDLSHVLIDIP